MSETGAKVLEFDIRGQICPSTLLTALNEINKLKGEIREGKVKLAFKTTNRDSIMTIPDAVKNMGYEVTVAKEEGYYVIIVACDAIASARI